MTDDSENLTQRLQSKVVGRETELQLLLATVTTGRHVLLEGPPGTSKTTMLKAITDEFGIPYVFVEGNAELTPGRLIGHHDPARVLTEGYSAETFTFGPLVRAMAEGGFLHFEELNRAPEDTLNALLTAIADRELTIPRVGTIHAEPTFRLVASMNPYDNVGTTRLSTSVRDRLCRIRLDYQDASEERAVVELRVSAHPDAPLDARLVDDAVAVTRATRDHEHVRQGSSVRGAIDLMLVARELLQIRRIDDADAAYRDTFFDAMLVALSGRIVVDEVSGLDADTILRDIWELHIALDRALAEPG
jgi:MoxR-like ATPase